MSEQKLSLQKVQKKRTFHADHDGGIQTTLGRPKTQGIRVLFDSGSTQALVQQSCVNKLSLRNETAAISNTAASQNETSE